MKLRIGDMLIQYGIISQEQLEKALQIQKTDKRRLGEILIDLGYLTSKDLIWILSEQADIPFVEVNIEMLDPDLVHRFPEQLLYENVILPLHETDQKIFIAQGDPTDTDKTAAVKSYTKKDIVVSGADPSTIERLLDSFFLAHRLNKVTQQIDKFNTLRIVTDVAHIELTSDKGQVVRMTGSVDISIQYSSKDKIKEGNTHD